MTPRTSTWPRSSPTAARWPSTTRACTRSARSWRAPSSRPCCRRGFPRSRGSTWPCSIGRRRARPTSAATSTTSTRPRPGGSSWSATSPARGRWRRRARGSCGTPRPPSPPTTAPRRRALRALSLYERSPAAVLRAANAALLEQLPADDFCTVALVEVDVEAMRARIALAGHPLPLFARQGDGVCEVGEPGQLLGAVEDPEIHDAEVDLRVGDLLVLYTD